MAIDYEKLKSFQLDDIEHDVTPRDVMLYALGLSLGNEPTNPGQLRFLYEDGLEALPTIGSVFGYPGFWIKEHPELGIDWKTILNGEQGIEIFRPLPVSGKVIGRTRIERVVDKGPGKNAVLHTVRDVTSAETGELLCRVTNAVVSRGAGGFGGPNDQDKNQSAKPTGAPDVSVDLTALPQAALIYRLSGDYNPLHADPKVATEAGFPMPILHGAATWGMVGYALLTKLCGDDPARFKRFSARFTSPVFPGETVTTEVWKTGEGEAVFRARVAERDVTVLDNGSFSYKA